MADTLPTQSSPTSPADVATADAAVPPAAPATIRRTDYRPPDWLVPDIALDFDLGLNATQVVATLTLTRNPAGDGSDRAVLRGDGLTPRDVRVDGAAAVWTMDGDDLVLTLSGDRHEVSVTTTIHPDRNTQLMGLFASNGMLCTQCEAEGFRRITFHPDRPDVLSTYRVRMEGDRATFPVLLSNGDRVEEGTGSTPQRHFAVWHDPWPKPSYLFALVAGQLVANRDTFVTMSGRDVALAIWVRDGDQDRTHHAMAALKASMAWDERVYGREYDLGIFNIVAVSDFNMGAMENKGLNVFNTRYILADPDTATDLDYDGVEGVVAHEYFHNWSGNRVTCRDWFQLSLKEGFTVYRDQSFSADMGSAPVKRIEDVRVLRAAQFPEDAGPLAHPIRPDSYQEISNFYTATVYNKGAEVIRMIATLLGPEGFRAGTDLYFDRHDGEAATCEDFVRAMEDASGVDLARFRRWYEQAGTPRLTLSIGGEDGGDWTLTVRQTVPPTPGQPDKAPMMMPLVIAAHPRDGNAPGAAQTVILTETETRIPLGRFATRPALSLNRGFSAPVTLAYGRAPGELAWLAAYDDDSFARYEALQQLMVDSLVDTLNGGPGQADAVMAAVATTLTARASDPAFVAEAVALPSEAFLGDQMTIVDPDAIRASRRALQAAIGRALDSEWRAILSAPAPAATDRSPVAKGERKLAAAALMMLWTSGATDADAVAKARFDAATTMTDRQAALATLAHGTSAARDAALAAFHARYADDALVLDKWFQVQAWSLRDDVVEQVRALADRPDFTLSNPNRVRALYGAFAANQAAFHRADGAGYALIADLVIALDPLNPQTAARMIPAFGRWRRFDPVRQDMMRAALARILGTPGLSRDTFEQASKSLAS